MSSTPRSGAQTPTSGVSSRKGKDAWHEVLDLCKVGFGTKMEGLSEEITRDIRQEVKEAVLSFRREANSAVIASDRPVGAQLMRVEDKVQTLEKLVNALPRPPDLAPVHQDLREVEASCLNANRQLASMLEQMTRASSQLHDQIQHSENSFADNMRRLEDKLLRLEESMQRSESKVGGDVSRVQTSVEGATSQIVSEVKKVQEQDEHYFKALDTTCAEAGSKVKEGLDQLSQASEAICGKIDSSTAGVSSVLQRIEGAVKHSQTKLGDVEGMQLALQDTIAREVQKMSKQDDRHYTDFNLTFESSMSTQRLQLEDMSSALKTINNHDALAREMKRDRIRQSIEFRQMIGELAKVQQALHIDYFRVAETTRAGAMNEEEAKLADEQLQAHQYQAKRVREFFTQTAVPSLSHSVAQTDPVKFEDTAPKKKREKENKKKFLEPARKTNRGFSGADKLKQAAKEASMKPPYDVFDFYHDSGTFQYVAKSSMFENTSLLMVIVNAVWIAVDTDLNPAAIIVDAEPVFLIMENVFCTFFTLELLIRFLAFEKKRNSLKDAWFIFDLCLVAQMIAETWIFPGIVMILNLSLSGTDGMGLLRMFKMVKLVRLSRMARLLRSVPELVIIIKGLRFAFRSVVVFFLLWGMIVYLFAVLFRQVTDGQVVGKEYFQSVPHAMNTLLLNGVFADTAALVTNMTDGNWLLWPLIVAFMTLVSLTLMYMLVGVLVDVVGVVAASEKEGLVVSMIAQQMRAEMQKLGYKDDAELSQTDFQTIMVDSGVLKICHSVGVDVAVLADMMDVLFEQASKGSSSLRFADLVEVVLSMRGSNPATVKDCKEQIRVTKQLLKESVDELLTEVRSEMSKNQFDNARPADSEESDLE
eukprot:TRINITY_DN18949_c0_g1_i2.p1 TRINITY_DN18949_c0_g1~~TRINITY_DN18949_c0_g1_i2.p1  ORF type:complete len:872 (+),score=190.74 TRINITY_DN18949_c0_g1_i2:78-2693(+)